MPAMPWSTTNLELPGDTPVIVMASEFMVRSMRDVPGFFTAGITVRRQALAAEGALGIWIDAKPMRKYFRFISAWRDETSLRAMVKADPHKELMKKFRPRMAWSKLVSWEASAAALPPNWESVRAQFIAQGI